MRVKELSDLVGISVRTLHHYDEIGLFAPERTTESGYRVYSDQDLEVLQQILFFRELGFPLRKIKFAGFDFSQNPYEQEARERWGDEAVDRSNAKVAAMSKEEQAAMGDAMNAIYAKLAALRHGSAQSEESQAAIKEWYDFLNRMGNYPPEAFRGLGQMYVDDERFTKNIDKFGEGLARFMRDAMAVYADRNQQ